jgi:hypothetical protein
MWRAKFKGTISIAEVIILFYRVSISTYGDFFISNVIDKLESSTTTIIYL